MEAKLDMNRMQKKVYFEGVGDSELLNPLISSTVALSTDAEDDAKSTSGSVNGDDDGDGDGDGDGDVTSCSSSSIGRKRRKERKERNCRKGEERRISWRSWLVEYAARRDVIDRPCGDDDEETGSTTTVAAAAEDGEAERNRLFWEACLAHGY